MSTGEIEHIKKIVEIKQHINNSKGQQRRQYIKCLHRLQKELNQYRLYTQKEVI